MGGFAPGDIPGLVVWAEADMTGNDLQTDGSNVTHWGDDDLTQFLQTTDAKRFVLVADAGDGLPELTCDGTDDFMSAASLTISSSCTLFFVFRAEVQAGLSMIMEHGPVLGPNPGLYVYIDTASDLFFGVDRGTGSTVVKKDAGSYRDDAYRVVALEHNGTLASMEGYVNGVDAEMSIVSGGDVGVSDTTDTLYLAMRAGASLPSKLGLRAVLVYSGMLSGEDRGLVTTYLNDKWGVY